MRLWAKYHGNKLFWALFGHFGAPRIFKILVKVTKSQAGVKLQKLSTSYLIFVCKYWCGKSKSSKNHHFWVKTHILRPPGSPWKSQKVLRMLEEVPQTSLLILVYFLWPSLFIWLGNKTKKFKKQYFGGKKSHFRPHISPKKSLRVPKIGKMLA